MDNFVHKSLSHLQFSFSNKFSTSIIFSYFCTLLSFLNHKNTSLHCTKSNNTEAYKKIFNNLPVLLSQSYCPEATDVNSLVCILPSLFLSLHQHLYTKWFFPLVLHTLESIYINSAEWTFGMSLTESKSINLLKLVAYKFLSYQISFQKGDSNLKPSPQIRD